MRKFTISNPTSGLTLGTYEADTKEEALNALARDAGYADFAAACEATGDDPADDADLKIVES